MLSLSGVKNPSPVQGLRQSGTLILRKEIYFTIAGVRFLSMIDGSTIHLHLHNFDMALKGRGIFSRDNMYGKLLATDHRTFGTTDFMSTYTACTRLFPFLCITFAIIKLVDAIQLMVQSNLVIPTLSGPEKNVVISGVSR